MVVLSAQVTDEAVNRLAGSFFGKYPSFSELGKAQPEELYPYIKSARFFRQKADRLVAIARILKTKPIPDTMEGLLELPGISRKSANVILRESGLPPEGVIVDLHVLRVAPRLGIAEGTNPEKIERQLMEKVAKKDWGEIGMALSFLGREICRPTNPNCSACCMNIVCAYYAKSKK